MRCRQDSFVTEVEIVGDQYFVLLNDADEQLIIGCAAQANFNDVLGFMSRVTQAGCQTSGYVLIQKEAQLARCPLRAVPLARHNICRIGDGCENILARQIELSHDDI